MRRFLVAIEQLASRFRSWRVGCIGTAIPADLFVGMLAKTPHGICVFDKEQKLIWHTASYREMYCFPNNLVLIGKTIPELWKLRAAAGMIDPNVNVEAARMSLSTGSSGSNRQRLPDGRTIDVNFGPMANGASFAAHHDVTEQQRLQIEVESINWKLTGALDNVPVGISMFDQDEKLIVCNALYRKLYLYPHDLDLIGKTATELAAVRFESGLYGHLPRDKFFRDRETKSAQGNVWLQRFIDGRVIEITRNYLPNGGYVVTHQDVTMRERLLREVKDSKTLLEEQNGNFAVAIENISQGLCLFDEERRVVLANRRYAEIYGLKLEEIKPGTKLSEIIARRVDAKLFVSKNTKSHPSSGKSFNQAGHKIMMHELSDGRAINVKYRQLDDGGLVATHEDITELQKAYNTLEQQHELIERREAELQSKHFQFDAAISHMAQGLTILDADRRLVLCNDQSLKIFGLSREQVRPGAALSDLLNLRIATGIASEELSLTGQTAFERGLNKGSGFDVTVQFKDGRQIAISSQPIKDGGWVITQQDITEARQSEARIAHMARHDTLTGLPNRVVLGEVLERTISHCRRGHHAALLFLDLDHFKAVNDTLGHAVGDKLLIAVAERLRLSIRDTDTVVRLGGDEFAILQDDIEKPEDAAALARRLIDTLNEPYEIDGRPISRSASVGIALAPENGETAEELLRNSDLALYRAKELGRGDYHFFEAALDTKMQKRRDLEDELRKAVQAGQFELHYQPLISATSKSIYGVEALLRWRHPERGMISPGDFIPIAEETGLINQIGEWAIREACGAAAMWPDYVRIAINLSPIQFRRPGLLQTITHALAETHIDPRRIELEITESLLLESNESVLATLHQFRELGIGIALDDFGTGYSSLSYLQKFPFSRIKIDRSFIQNVGDKKSAFDIVKAIVALARAVNMSITAEGIETEKQLNAAKDCGCTDFQGYLFSKPKPLDEVTALLIERSVMAA